MKDTNMNTNLTLNTLSNMIVFFKSIIGPYTRKPKIEVDGNIFLNDAPIKASASEHKDKK